MLIWGCQHTNSDLNTELPGHLYGEPFDERTNPHDLNTKLVCYLDPHCIWNLNSDFSRIQMIKSNMLVKWSAYGMSFE